MSGDGKWKISSLPSRMREALSLDGQQFYSIFSFSWLSGFRYWDFKLINNHIPFLLQVQSQLITRCCYQREAYIFESALLQIRLNYKMQFGLWPPDIPLSKLLSSSRFGQLQASLTVARQNGTCTSQEQSFPQTRGALKEPKWACLVLSPKFLNQVSHTFLHREVWVRPQPKDARRVTL